MSEDDKVGYKKPPKRSQFKPGQSGNPKGRKKGRRNLKTDLTSLLEKRIPIREDGEPRYVTRQEALLLSLFEKAVRGDVRASSQVIAMVIRAEAQEPSQPEVAPVTDNDRAIVADFLRRHQAKPKP
jgi:hypothetical protein